MEQQIKYSCQCHPQNYTHLNGDLPFIAPKKDTYYWYVDNITNDMDKYKVLFAFNEVAAIWQRALDNVKPVGQFLHLKSTSDKSKADFIISFGKHTHKFSDSKDKQHTCPFPFDGEQGVLAHAWSLITVKPYGGQMHVDESEHWSEMHKRVGSKLYVHLFTVALHEWGHMWDIGHSEIKEAVMFPSYTGVKMELHQDDLDAFSKKLSPIKQNIYDEYYVVAESPEVPSEKEELNNGCLAFLSGLIK